MARWLVELKGEPFDLEEFPRWFPDGDTYVLHEGDHYYITGPALEKFTEPAAVRDVAIQLIDEFYATGSLFLPSLIKPTVGSVITRDDNGRRTHHHVLALEGGQARMKGNALLVKATGETVAPQRPTQAQNFLEASRADKHLKAAVMLWADPPRSWPRLYRILEEIEGSLGHTVDKAGICSDAERERFRRTANSAEVAGKDARHRLGKFDPPENPMNLGEADAFISRLLSAALRSASEKRTQ